MNEPVSPNSSASTPAPADAGDREAVFRQVALGSGLIDAPTIDHVAGSASTPGESLGERLVCGGHLSESGRQAIEHLVEERLVRGASASTLGSAATGSYTPSGATASFQTPNARFGDYELLGEIARGGMGVVYKARHARLNRLVALKMIRAGEFASEHEVRRFYSEAKAAGQLDHPGIVPVYEVGEIAGHHFYSMALVLGQSLNARIKERGPLEPRTAAQLMKLVADAVAHAHDRGIVHRDIKPHNILLDENEQPRVTDFGLAKHALADSELTATGQVMGTPSYMPPEQATGAANVGPAADTYSLGATLYCLLTGRPPFHASSPAQTIQQVLNEQPIPPRRLNPEVPTDLETICMKCLRKEIAGRYATAREFGDDLARFLGGEPILARPAGAIERGWKWVRRRPVAAGLWVASAVAVLALVATAVLASVQSRLSGLNVQLSGLNDRLETQNGELTTANQAAEKARNDATAQRDAADRAKRELAQIRYASDIAIAGRAWREGDVGRMSGLLDRLIPKPGEEDLRNFEWYYLRGLERHDVWRLEAMGCAISPNGKMLAIVQNGALELLDTDTRKLLHRLPQPGYGGGGYQFSRDSKRVAFSVTAKEVAVWDAEKGTEVRRMKADDLNAAGVAISDDGSLAAACGQGNDRSVRVWDVATGTQLHHWKASGGYPSGPTFAPDGARIAFKSNKGIEIHDLKSAAQPTIISHTLFMTVVLRFHPSGKWLVAAHADDTVLVWDATGQPAKPPFASGGLRGSTIDFTSDGKFLATGTASDNAVCCWEGTTGKLLSTRKGHWMAPVGVSILPDGKRVFSRSFDNSNRLWNVEGQQEADEFPGAAVFPRFSPDQNSRVIAYLDRYRYLALKDGNEDRPFPPPKERVSRYDFNFVRDLVLTFRPPPQRNGSRNSSSAPTGRGCSR